MLHDSVLAVHVAFGVAGVGLGPPVVWQAHRGVAGRLAIAFHIAVVGVCGSAFGLAALDFAALWWLVPIAIGTYGFVLLGFRAGRNRHPRWAASAVRGYGGAYIALWTAIVVVSVGSSVPTWVLPAAIGTPIVELLAIRRRPTHRAGDDQGVLAAGPSPVVRTDNPSAAGLGRPPGEEAQRTSSERDPRRAGSAERAALRPGAGSGRSR